jgi:photosystem II stability/assembly factor-like uncharacterized protein
VSFERLLYGGNMKKVTIIFLTLILSIFLFTSTSFAGSWNGWIYQNPYPTKNTLLGVKFITPQKGWVVGEHGTILYTEDGGENWEAQESGTEEDLKSVTFMSEKVGWAVGNGGIIHTEDGGKKWERQVNSKDLLHIVFFLNENEGWIGGAMGTFLHTKDGGENWNKEDIGSYADIAGIFFLNSNMGWVLSGGKVYRTKNGGKNWEMSELPPVSFLAPSPSEQGWQGSIFFINEKRGWATVGFDYMYSTEDGGKTWKTIKVPNSVDRIAFTDENNGCIAARSIICTKDGGKTWKEILSAKPGIGADIEGYSVAIWGFSFANRNTGFAVGKGGQIFKTEDRGKTWKAKSRAYRWDLYFLDSQKGWANGSKRNKGSIIKTEDGGKTWKTQKEFDNRIEISFFFINPAIGWAVANEQSRDNRKGPLVLNYIILYTNAGGKTWITQIKEPGGEKYISNQLLDIFFMNPNVGWVGGYNGMILHTKDGGKNWEKQNSGTKLHVTKIRFIDDKKGIAIADTRIAVDDYEDTIPEATILYTDDGGQHWHEKWKRRIITFRNLFFVNKNNAWVVGKIPDGALLMYSNNGGKTWTEKKVKDISLDSACFVDKDHGALFTKEGRMLITKDGGRNWERKIKPIRREPFRCEDIFK